MRRIEAIKRDLTNARRRRDYEAARDYSDELDIAIEARDSAAKDAQAAYDEEWNTDNGYALWDNRISAGEY